MKKIQKKIKEGSKHKQREFGGKVKEENTNGWQGGEWDEVGRCVRVLSITMKIGTDGCTRAGGGRRGDIFLALPQKNH